MRDLYLFGHGDCALHLRRIDGQCAIPKCFEVGEGPSARDVYLCERYTLKRKMMREEIERAIAYAKAKVEECADESYSDSISR